MEEVKNDNQVDENPQKKREIKQADKMPPIPEKLEGSLIKSESMMS